MKTKEEILKGKFTLFPLNESQIEQVVQAMEEYKIQILEEVKFGFDICSDTSAFCLGYRNLVEKIRREKENQPIDKSISPIKKDI